VPNRMVFGFTHVSRAQILLNRRSPGIIDRLRRPWPDACDPVDGDVGDIAGHSSLGRWELNLGPKVRVSEPLEKSGSAPFGDMSCPVDDEVLNEPALVVAIRLERQGNPRVVADVADLAALCQVSGDNLLTIEADPDNRHLGAAIVSQGDEVRERRRLEYRPNAVRDRAHTQSYRDREQGTKTVIETEDLGPPGTLMTDC